MTREYLTIFASSADDFTKKLNDAAAQGFHVNDVKYAEYPIFAKGEGNAVMQSYVAVMHRLSKADTLTKRDA